MKKNRKELTK